MSDPQELRRYEGRYLIGAYWDEDSNHIQQRPILWLRRRSIRSTPSGFRVAIALFWETPTLPRA